MSRVVNETIYLWHLHDGIFGRTWTCRVLPVLVIYIKYMCLPLPHSLSHSLSDSVCLWLCACRKNKNLSSRPSEEDGRPWRALIMTAPGCFFQLYQWAWVTHPSLLASLYLSRAYDACHKLNVHAHSECSREQGVPSQLSDLPVNCLGA